jgi:hypothetical protein
MKPVMYQDSRAVIGTVHSYYYHIFSVRPIDLQPRHAHRGFPDLCIPFSPDTRSPGIDSAIDSVRAEVKLRNAQQQVVAKILEQA